MQKGHASVFDGVSCERWLLLGDTLVALVEVEYCKLMEPNRHCEKVCQGDVE
jgi:hypothetical protein